MPVREELTRLADFSADISDWLHERNGQSAPSIASTGIRTSRKLNQSINLVVSNMTDRHEVWLRIKTDNVDQVIAELNDEARTIQSKALLDEVGRIENSLTKALAQQRPPAV